jgi:methionyl-tRNA formyltransferase
VKIEFLTQDDSNYILPFFDEFIRHYGEEFHIQQISCCRAMGKRPRAKLLWELFWLYGPCGFSRLATRTATARLMAKIAPSSKTARSHSIAQLCHAHDIPCEHIENPNSSAFVEAIKARNPDVIVSVACPYILKEPILKLAPLGCINIHHAPLPKYKGMMPVFWQMYHGEQKVGLTIHYMAPKVDEGAAILQDELQINPGESLDSLIRRSKRYGAHCMARVLRQVQSNQAGVLELDQRGGSYFTFPTRKEIREFRNRGFRAI